MLTPHRLEFDMHGMTGGRLRVLSIAHTATKRALGRMRYEKLAIVRPDIALTLVAPDRWQEYGSAFRIEPEPHGLDLRFEPVRLVHAPRANWYLHHYPRLRSLFASVRPDVIHLWEEPWSLVALQAALLRDRLLPRTALVLETDQNILRRFTPPFEQIRRLTQRHTDLLIGRQQESLRVARATGYDGPTAIVEYGVDRDYFRPGNRATDRKALGADMFTLGYVGRIVREKGLLDVLDAIAAARTPVSLFVLGSGPDRPALEARARELGLADRLRLFDPRPPAEVGRFMGGLDALVLMSRTTRTWKEQFGRVIMEAQACGTPVIGSDSGAIPDVVGAGGWIVEEGNATALAHLIDRLAGNPSEIEAAREAGLAQAGGRFSFETIANALGQAFTEAAEQRGSRLRPRTDHARPVRASGDR